MINRTAETHSVSLLAVILDRAFAMLPVADVLSPPTSEKVLAASSRPPLNSIAPQVVHDIFVHRFAAIDAIM
jgi:hypothetical protein